MQAWLPAIRLRTTYGFWIMALLPGITGGLRGMALWGAIVFGSIVLHELGHALSGISGRRHAVIVLHQLGGSTEFEPRLLSARQATWSALAGPLVSVLAGGALFVARRALISAPSWLSVAMWVNLGWGALNLLPIVPFDGGRLLMDRLGKKRPLAALLVSSATTAAVTTIGVVTIRHLGFAILFAGVSILSLFELAKLHEQLRTQHIDAQLGRAQWLVVDQRYDEAILVAKGVLVQARDFDTRNAALTMLAWACLGQGRPREASDALGKVLPAEAVDPYTLAAVQRACGERDRAIQTLERARDRIAIGRQAARLLIDLYAERGDLQRAFATTLDHLRVLGPEDARLVVDALEQADDFRNAAALREAIGSTGPIA